MCTSTSKPLWMHYIFNIFRTLRDFRFSQGYCWGLKFSGVKIFTDVSKNSSAFIFGLDCLTLKMKALRCGSTKPQEIFCQSHSVTSHKYSVLQHCFMAYFTFLHGVFYFLPDVFYFVIWCVVFCYLLHVYYFLTYCILLYYLEDFTWLPDVFYFVTWHILWAGYLSRYSDWLRAGRSGIESRWGRDFPPVHTGPGAHPASCTMGTGSFPGVKCGRGVLLTTHPLLVPWSRKSRAIPLPALWATPGL